MAKKSLQSYVKPPRRRGGKNEPRNDASGDDWFIDMGRDGASRFNPILPNKKTK